MGNALKQASSPRSEDEIQAFLRDEIAEMVKMKADDVDMTREIADFGLDSRQAIALSGSLEVWLGRRLSATLIWDYPTIAGLARFLADGR